ncbi:MAG: hypothetical protein JEY91_11000 [Spirochaetaceae bacterium]|nr:hypothetical protein [Spirochaetaceae bacterium]
MEIKPTIQLYSSRSDLNLISFFLLLLSDVFIAVILFFGLSQQINQFTDEYEYFPYEYRNMLIDNEWVENNVIEKISSKLLGVTRSTFETNKQIEKLHSKCGEIEALFSELENDTSLIKEFSIYDRQLTNYKALNRNEKNSPDGLQLLEQIHALSQSLKDSPRVQKLIETIFTNQKNNYAKDIMKFRKLFALKRTVFDLVFLLPVLAAFILWNRNSFSKGKYIQTIISSHYIIVAFLPILFESIRLIIEVIPKLLLKTVYDFLLKLNLITFWYYGVLLISIGFIVFLIWIFQTKIFTKERYRLKQYEKQKCMSCNTKIDYHEKHCPACGFNLYISCPTCKKDTIIYLPFCIHCGNEISKR